MPEICAIIPARFASVRFPGKPLQAETGRPLIQHVVEAAARCARIGRVVVATDDRRIAEAVEGFGGEVAMTSGEHDSGTSRLTEAAEGLALAPDAIVVNVQGDEPEIEPESIDAAIDALLRRGAPVATIASPFAPEDDPADPNIVKVVRTLAGDAMYFSRSPIPRPDVAGAQEGVRPLHHVGLYVYRRSFLDVFRALAPTPLERAERLEQLRILEHAHRIAVGLVERAHPGIDTPAQYRAFVDRWSARRGAS